MPVVDRIKLCAGAGCVAAGSMETRAALVEGLAKRGLDVSVVPTGCLGPCAGGPVVVCEPGGVLYQKVKPADVDELIDKTVVNGEIVDRLAWRRAETGARVDRMSDDPFFGRQLKIALRNCGEIDPTKIDDYIARDGYKALTKVLTSMSPEAVVDEILRSGLRGRGGAGYPTGLKWAACREAAGDVKYVICNGDEGDPGAFMDRSLLEGDPHSVIEAMTIAGYAIGAGRGYAYIRAEYPLAVERMGIAIRQSRERGFLGSKILGTDFAFDLEIRMGSGAFVCGEETALMTSIEGKRGEPRPRPPYPAQAGLWGKPSLLNNVETYASVPVILSRGAAWFAAIGTEKSKGTKVFALAGSVRNTGLVEVPIGTSLRDIVYGLGGGVTGGKRFKAAQLGGPSGGCIPVQHVDVPVDYETLNSLGAIMGSGGLIVIDEDTCMVDMARFFLDFVQSESCGKCPPCRIGTKRMHEIVCRICEGKGEEADLDRLEELGRVIRETSLCGLGQTAPNPVLSTLRHFRDEYLAHIRDHRCVAGVCPGLERSPCQSACPAGVDVPGYVALIGAKKWTEALRLHRERNPFAGVCARVCVNTCEIKCKRRAQDGAVSIRALKRFMTDEETVPQLPEIRRDPANAERAVAIVGAGPAGLSCAYFLARLGYRPTVFEAASRPGGTPAQTIPSYRLPREVMDREIRLIEGLGVTIRTDMKLGRDFTLADLREDGHLAVFLGIGAPHGIKLEVPGSDLSGVDDAIDYLRTFGMRGSVRTGHDVVVIGGGNAAIDAARTAVRLGARTATIVYRCTREEIPVYAEEIEETEAEGVALHVLTEVEEIVGDDGRVGAVRCRTLAIGDPDRTGKRQFVRTADPPFILPADQVIVALGQRLDVHEALGEIVPALTPEGFIAADPTGQTSVEWLFAGGDDCSGPKSVVEAVAAGERAAVAIDCRLSGEEHAFWREDRDVGVKHRPHVDPVETPRAHPEQQPVAKRRRNFDEVERPWTEDVAVAQAKRCLRCDYREKV